jgi:membrane fusion protein (multidrug efflux system)
MDEIKASNGNRKKIAAAVFALIIAVGAVTLYAYLSYKAVHITTDDAYVDGDKYIVSTKVPGTVKAVHVGDNMFVKKGDLMLEIDPADYDVKVVDASSGLVRERARLTEAGEAVKTAEKKLDELRAKTDAARATLELNETRLKQAEVDAKRSENLFAKNVISKERFEKTDTVYQSAIAEVKAAREKLKEALAGSESQKAFIRQVVSGLESQQALIRQKDAVLRGAELSYGYTRVYAPADGYVTKKSVQPGEQIQAGQPLMALVALGAPWITANYKENQLEKVRQGQKVSIKVDMYPGRAFSGRVDSIMAGTGAVFSLFPPENAAGNYVKVVQRIPVKIMLDNNSDPGHLLRLGMSVEPTILIQ